MRQRGTASPVRVFPDVNGEDASKPSHNVLFDHDCSGRATETHAPESWPTPASFILLNSRVGSANVLSSIRSELLSVGKARHPKSWLLAATAVIDSAGSCSTCPTNDRSAAMLAAVSRSKRSR